MASYPDLAVEDLVIDVLIEALLWVHIDAVSPQVVLDLGAREPQVNLCTLLLPTPTNPILASGTQITVRLKFSRSSTVRLSARAITGTTFTVRHSRCRNSMSRGRRLLRQDSDGGGSGSSKCVSEGMPAHSPCREPLLLRSLLLLSALVGPATSPVPSGRHEVHTAVHPGVGDVALAGDEDLLLQVLLILSIDVAQDGVPAGVGDGPDLRAVPRSPTCLPGSFG